MKTIYLYYATGSILVLLTLILTITSMIDIEDIIVFAMTGFLLIILGIVQHIIILNEKYNQIKIILDVYSSIEVQNSATKHQPSIN